MTQTLLAQAFSKAGYHPPESAQARLRRMMREAIRAAGGRADATRDYFIAELVKADDAGLLWELFASVRAVVIGRLLTETLIEMRAEVAPRDADGKAKCRLPQGQTAAADPSATDADGEARSQVPRGQATLASPSAPDAEAGASSLPPIGGTHTAPAAAPKPAPAPQNPARKALGYAARDEVARQSILRTFHKIGGVPLANVTGGAARAWLRTHERDGRFVRLVSHQVPDEIAIGAMIPEDEADRLYRLATEADNA